MTVIIDTNVILVANRQHEAASEECVATCARRLLVIVESGRVAIDSSFHILNEYQNRTLPRSGTRSGDRFVRWLLRNNANPDRCDQVDLVEHAERGFNSFPEDERLANFDPADRKFVAVANAHEAKPPILQAVDSKWVDWEAALGDCGLEVDFLCRADVERFDAAKKKRKARS